MQSETTAPTYHVLLVGIDRYPPGYNSLHGCVNDIDAIEQLLLTPPGVGIPPEQIRVTRLAAPRADHSPLWHSQAATQAPTKANLLQALQALAGPTVKAADRVLIYYSGHGDEKLWQGSSVWHEALVPHNDRNIEYLFDVEINALINAVAARTSDLTIVLDSCHSAGATRDLSDIQVQGAIRVLKGDDIPIAPPDLTALGLDSRAARDRSLGGSLLQAPDPDYLVVVACQSDEKAREGAYPLHQPTHGVFTHSLLRVLADRKDATQRAGLRWSDIWPVLLASAAERNAQLGQSTQHPWIIGRSERKVFGGPWEKMDAGYQVTIGPDGSYAVGAGTLMGVTEDAEIAIYGSTPNLFPPIGTPDDHPAGHLRVREAGPSSAVAMAVEPAFRLPDGARGRLVNPGTSGRLRVSLKPENATLAAQLAASPLLEIVPAAAPDADVEILTQPGGGWIIGNDTEPLLATVPQGEDQTLRAALEHYHRYNTMLRMARNCNDPQLSNCLSVRFLDCNDDVALAALSREALADPKLAEAPRDADRIYAVPSGFKSCVRVTNNSVYKLQVALLVCTSGGKVDYLSDALLRERSAHVMWLDSALGKPFEAWPDEPPEDRYGIALPDSATDRMIVIGTTKRAVDLRALAVDRTVQEVVDELLSSKGMRGQRPQAKPAAPVELWTATVTPLRIART